MFTEEYSRYTLLAQAHVQGNRTSSWSLDKRTVILISALILPVFIFCATYMILFGIYEKVVYPHDFAEEVSDQNLYRAKSYNAFPKASNRTLDLHFKVGQGAVPQRRLVCYYNFPSDERSLQVKNLDASLCTHINVAFARIVNDSIYLEEKDEATLRELVQLKESSKDLKILLSVGGAGGGAGFPETVLNHTNRKSFIKSVLYYIKNYNIDGIDLDWEFPNDETNGDKRQRIHFTQLLEELRHSINRQNRYKYLLTVAVAAPTYIVDNAYDVSYMNDYVDYVNLMSYDYHYYTKYTPFTGFNAPLYASSSEKYYLATLNINYSVNYWNYLGMERGKIVVGLPTYGHTFRLANMRNNVPDAPSNGYGRLGSLGFVDYIQVCTFLSNNHVTPVFDMDTKSPYASKFSEWISFDNAESLTYKAEYIRDNNLGGAMLYSLNSDDYRGACKNALGATERFPLTRVVKQVLDAGTE